MRVSFIVTSYNIAGYIGQCLDSLAACVRPGDQVIVVDDGSRDESPDRIKAALTNGVWPADVEKTPIFLGANTHGGVGIGANIGLSRATREAVFFVDGDDWLAPAGVLAARAAFEQGGQDILIANYLVFNESTQHDEPPSDAHLWPKTPPQDLDAARDLALSLNAVPWRKFYRRDWLKAQNKGQGLRFEEGNFFYEDNPFHWACCLRATSIGFLDVCVAHHRMNRAGQTMSDGGAGFAAMFAHYETIETDLHHLELTEPERKTRLMQVDLWLATNMAWQLERISLAAMPAYCAAAAAALCGARKTRWQRLCAGELATRELGYLVSMLLSGGAAALMQAWLPWQMMRRFEQHQNEVEHRLSQLEAQIAVSGPLFQETRDISLRTYNNTVFSELQNRQFSWPMDLNDT